MHGHYLDLSNPNQPARESETGATRPPTVKAAIQRISFVVVANSPTINVGRRSPALDAPRLASTNDALTKLTSAAMGFNPCAVASEQRRTAAHHNEQPFFFFIPATDENSDWSGGFCRLPAEAAAPAGGKLTYGW